MPPLAGSRCELCVARQPRKTWKTPSSSPHREVHLQHRIARLDLLRQAGRQVEVAQRPVHGQGQPLVEARFSRCGTRCCGIRYCGKGVEATHPISNVPPPAAGEKTNHTHAHGSFCRTWQDLPVPIQGRRSGGSRRNHLHQRRSGLALLLLLCMLPESDETLPARSLCRPRLTFVRRGPIRWRTVLVTRRPARQPKSSPSQLPCAHGN